MYKSAYSAPTTERSAVNDSIEIPMSDFSDHSLFTSVPDPSAIGGEPDEIYYTNSFEEIVKSKASKDASIQKMSRRTIFIILVIVLLGAAAIGVTLGLILPKQLQNASSSSSGALQGPDGPTPTVSVVLTPSPSLALLSPSPTTSPTTLAPSLTPTLAPTLKATAVKPTAPTVAPTPGYTFNFVPSEAPVAESQQPTSILQAFLISSLYSQTNSTNTTNVVASVFENPDSYQSKALAWLETSTAAIAATNGTLPDERLIQRYVLACIYMATYGQPHRWSQPGEEEGWGMTDGWMVAERNECTWFGITCNTALQVEMIQLNANNVTGTWPDETRFLASSLMVLDIGTNNIWNRNKEIDFLGALTNLIELDLGVTYFQYDGIPEVLGNLVNLELLNIEYTLLFGPIRGQQVFSNLLFLEYLQMGGNAYNQSLPSEITSLPLLTNFYCDNSYLEGTIDFVVNMPVIFELWLDHNPDLGGTIPTGIGTRFSSLHSLSLTDCAFTGTIPTEMGSLVNMQQLWLSANQLTGPIPTQLGALQSLTFFDLSTNLLTGAMPNQVCAANTPTGLFDDLCVDCDLVKCCCCTCCTSTTC